MDGWIMDGWIIRLPACVDSMHQGLIVCAVHSAHPLNVQHCRQQSNTSRCSHLQWQQIPRKYNNFTKFCKLQKIHRWDSIKYLIRINSSFRRVFYYRAMLRRAQLLSVFRFYRYSFHRSRQNIDSNRSVQFDSIWETLMMMSAN